MSKIMSEIIIERLEGSNFCLGHLLLNRSTALNALNQSMCETIVKTLRQWQADPQVKGVIISGQGEKAFCAGGDIVALYHYWQQGKQEKIKEFFKCEYELNYLLATYEKPVIPLIHGITMGGGIGLSVHCSHRVAFADALFAMPETAIGFFPDVGSSYLLSRLSTLGMYLALTGHRFNAHDAVNWGFADYLLHPEQREELLKQLLALREFNGETLSEVLELLQQPVSGLALDLEKVNHFFSPLTLEEIFLSLHEEKELTQRRQKMSPSSLAITFKLLKQAKQLSRRQCFTLDYNLSQQFIVEHDFFEGIRAMLVDKDKQPQWQPKSLEQLTKERVEQYFLAKEPLFNN